MSARIYIYKITNQITNESYIGQTINPNSRWSYHCCQGRNKLRQHKLYDAMKEYGIDCFDFTLIDDVRIQSEADRLEQSWISFFVEKGLSYNIEAGGLRTPRADYTKNKISETMQGKSNFEGKHHSEETKRKIAEGNRKPKPRKSVN